MQAPNLRDPYPCNPQQVSDVEQNSEKQEQAVARADFVPVGCAALQATPKSSGSRAVTGLAYLGFPFFQDPGAGPASF